VATKAPRSTEGAVPDRRGPLADAWASRRLLYLDNLKVILISVVIAGHAVIGYSELDAWSYSDVREVTLSPVTSAALFVGAVPFGLLVIPLLFMVSGLLSAPSLERKGPKRFVRDRLLRLGVPFVVFALLLWPFLEYALFRVLGNVTDSYAAYLGREGTLDAGVLWFVGALLAFSLAYALWVWVRRSPSPRRRAGPMALKPLLVLALMATVATFLVRLLLPFESDNRYVDLNMWQWPAAAAVFALGVAAHRDGWLTAVPDRLRRQSRNITLGAVGAFAVFVGLGLAVGSADEQSWTGGWHWIAFVFAVGECTLSVFGPVWLLGVAQRRLDRRFRWARPAVSRSAYAAFLLQGPVLVGLALAARPLPLPAEAKALLVALGGVAGSFALAWLLIRRVSGMARVI
jgi:fucose 4-O-acetylase-like acetyltransferase